MTEHDSSVRREAIRLMRTGRATMSEVARLAGVGRQLASYWAAVEGLDVFAAREAYLRRIWRPKPQEPKS